jgi:hypothetical protein
VGFTLVLIGGGSILAVPLIPKAWVHTTGMAAAVEKICSGCQRIMQMLAKGLMGKASIIHTAGMALC